MKVVYIPLNSPAIWPVYATRAMSLRFMDTPCHWTRTLFTLLIWMPFKRDAGLPSAVLMECLPNPLIVNCVTYSKERMGKALDGIRQIHSAFIEHNDPHPRNILIVPGERGKGHVDRL